MACSLTFPFPCPSDKVEACATSATSCTSIELVSSVATFADAPQSALDENRENAVQESKLRRRSDRAGDALASTAGSLAVLVSAGRVDEEPTTRTWIWLLLAVLPLLLVRSRRLMVQMLPACERLMVRTICGRIWTSLCDVELDDEENVRSRVVSRRLGL